MRAITNRGYIPTRAHADDAGTDFRSVETVTLQPHEGHVFDLKTAVEIPLGHFGYMASKSGLMVNHGIICLGGIIDSGFRGEIKVRMYNTSNEPYTIEAGDKLVQMVVIPCLCEDFIQVSHLADSAYGRNETGFGSTGR